MTTTDTVANQSLETTNERAIVRKVAEELIAAGYTVRFFDGEEDDYTRTTDVEVLLSEMFVCEEEYIKATKPGAKPSFVSFIYGNGNNGADVISDHGTSLTEVIKGAYELADSLEVQ